MRAHRLVTALALSVGAALAVPAGTQAAPLPEHGYVTNTYVLPVTTNQADRLGRDLDGDGTRDNALGRLFPVLAQQGLDLTTAQQAAVTAGSTVMLHSLRTTRLTTTKDATWQVFLGTPTESPDLTGSGTFPIGPATTRSKKLPATITDHKVKTATGVVPVQLDFGIGAFELTLTAARITATCTRTGCTGGHITGAVTRTQRDLVFLPRLADLVQAVIVRDCPGPDPSSCLPDAQGGQLQQQFDANDDMVVTADELGADPLVASVLAPDLDLQRRDGSPGHDGVKDSLSFGAGFTTVSATLDRG